MLKTIARLVVPLVLATSAAAQVGDLSAPMLLIARPELRDTFFSSTVLVVSPIGDDQHAGFIINRPSSFTLGTAFPGQVAAHSQSTHVYVGGPFMTEALFALARQETSPGGASIKLMDGLYAAYEEAVIDGLIAAQADAARFVFGFVAWRPGELRQEIELGAWYLMAPDASVMTRRPDGLWEELVHRLQAPASERTYATTLRK